MTFYKSLALCGGIVVALLSIEAMNVMIELTLMVAEYRRGSL